MLRESSNEREGQAKDGRPLQSFYRPLESEDPRGQEETEAVGQKGQGWSLAQAERT